MKEVQETPLMEIIGILVGEASMCWSEAPTSVFDSTKAIRLAEEACKKLERRVWLESTIKGHMEAMRPLLDEWSGKL